MLAATYLRVLKILVAIPIFAVAAVTVLLGSLWLDHFRETTLPKPTGPFAVGRTQDVWTDSAHRDPLAPLSGTDTKLIAWIWYPAAAPSGQTSADYLPAAWRIALARQTSFILTEFVARDLSRVHTHSARDPEVSPERKSYPVVLMRGGHSALTTDYTTLAEDLASHGYVVVGIDAPYRTFLVVLPGGAVIARLPENNAELGSEAQRVRVATRLVQAWGADMSFALDELKRMNDADGSRFRGKLDLQHVGAFGHSLGGAEALQFCHDDSRCKAGIDVDGAPFGSVVAEGISQPFMFLMSDHSDEPVSETRPIEAQLHSIFDRLTRNRRVWVKIRRATHFGFQDPVKSPILMSVLRRRGNRLKGTRQLTIASQCINAFFDVYLRGGSVSRLELHRENPEVECVR